MKEINSKDKSLNLELARNLIKDNYKNSGSESLNPKIYQNGEDDVCFLLFDNEEMVAGMNVIFDFYNWAHIHMTWVKDSYRGKGFGTKIMEMVKNIQKKKLHRYYYGNVAISSQRFFMKNGL